MSVPAEPWSTINEGAAHAGVSRRTFYKMLPDLERAGVAVRCPPVTGRVRMKLSALDAWLERSGRKAPRQAAC